MAMIHGIFIAELMFRQKTDSVTANVIQLITVLIHGCPDSKYMIIQTRNQT